MQKGHEIVSFCTPIGFLQISTKPLFSMAGSTGLEPAASAVTVTGLLFSTTYKAAETAKSRGSHVRHPLLWVGLWVEKSRAVSV